MTRRILRHFLITYLYPAVKIKVVNAEILSVLHVGILDKKSKEGHRAANQEHPDKAMEPVFSINPVSDPMDSGFLSFELTNNF